MPHENGKTEDANTVWRLEAESKGPLVSLEGLLDMMAKAGMTRITLSNATGQKINMVKSETQQWKLTLSG
jgi:hypothetical protein